MCDSSHTSKPTSYFIMKCADMDSLQQCIKTNEWACRKRNKQPHPFDLLVSSHERGCVILIFSVNGQHGWHGFCQSCFEMKPSEKSTIETNKGFPKDLNMSSNVPLGVKSECTGNASEDEGNVWYRFPVQWIVHYQNFNAYSCLDFKCTENLLLPDGSPVNKARNWQELSNDVGNKLCALLKNHHTHLLTKEQEQQALKKPESFFKSDQGISISKERETWQTVITKITKDLGKVHLACPFGSQRYNCNVPESDLDIFIVYQAKTTSMLGLDPPQQTIKNSHHEEVDYSVLELQRYCELLVKGDAKCVETLFLSETPIIVTGSSEWRELCSLRNLLLTRQCLEKYMKEINGTTGLKQFQRWRDVNPNTEELTSKLAKLGYIVLRLLQNARDMAKSNEMVVFRKESSLEKDELMTVRRGDFTYSKFMEVVDRYLQEIERHKEQLIEGTQEAKYKIQDWLIECRIQDLKLNPKAPGS
ncbi:nucleotidyltransferase [Elysia marginata]|uniref:Nucleotidyltransferase n=1 Tax=Elysia marginata TaxID=1093978 RepID=A0AAV4JRU5_9GAST|nr:nucleotidyltransferase [Elysia marginata]